MEKLIQFLKINDRVISFVRQDETIFIAIKPICEALKVEYTHAFKSIKEDSILSSKIAKISMMNHGDFQPRKFICLPERYIYGWLFRLRSKNTFINEYREKCYNLLFNHFHGSLTERKNVLIEKAEIKTKRQLIEIALKEDERYTELCDLKGRELRIGKTLKDLDEKLIDSQLALSFQS